MDTMQHSYTQVMRENDQLKAALNDFERSGIQMKSMFQTKDAQTSQMDSDIERMKGIIEKERLTSKKLEENYRIKIEALQVEIRELQ